MKKRRPCCGSLAIDLADGHGSNLQPRKFCFLQKIMYCQTQQKSRLEKPAMSCGLDIALPAPQGLRAPNWISSVSDTALTVTTLVRRQHNQQLRSLPPGPRVRRFLLTEVPNCAEMIYVRDSWGRIATTDESFKAFLNGLIVPENGASSRMVRETTPGLRGS